MNNNLAMYMPVDQIKIGITRDVYFEARGNNARIITAVIAVSIICAVAYLVSKTK